MAWLHVSNCCKGNCLIYQEGGIIGILFCHQTGGPIIGWVNVIRRAYNWDFNWYFLCSLILDLLVLSHKLDAVI